MTDREASRLLTRCEQLEHENEELRTEIKHLKDERPIKIGDMVEVFQATRELTWECDVGVRGVVDRLCEEDETVHLNSGFGEKRAVGNWVSLCDVQRV